jgi:hypothetical protein
MKYINLWQSQCKVVMTIICILRSSLQEAIRPVAHIDVDPGIAQTK